MEWVAIPFSRGSSRPWGQTWVSHMAGRFFTIWVTREALLETIFYPPPPPPSPLPLFYRSQTEPLHPVRGLLDNTQHQQTKHRVHVTWSWAHLLSTEKLHPPLGLTQCVFLLPVFWHKLDCHQKSKCLSIYKNERTISFTQKEIKDLKLFHIFWASSCLCYKGSAYNKVTWELLPFGKVNEVYGSMFLGNLHSKERQSKMY